MKTGVETVGTPLRIPRMWHWDLFLKFWFLAKAKGKLYNQLAKHTSTHLLLVDVAFCSREGSFIWQVQSKWKLLAKILLWKVQTIGHLRSFPMIT